MGEARGVLMLLWHMGETGGAQPDLWMGSGLGAWFQVGLGSGLVVQVLTLALAGICGRVRGVRAYSIVRGGIGHA